MDALQLIGINAIRIMACATANTIECDFKTQLDKTLESIAFDFDFTLQDLCTEMEISRSSLHRKIIACEGVSISIYIRAFRLNKALELLHITDQSISRIGFEVGFSNSAYFSRCFKEQFGMSAKEIRKKKELE